MTLFVVLGLVAVIVGILVAVALGVRSMRAEEHDEDDWDSPVADSEFADPDDRGRYARRSAERRPAGRGRRAADPARDGYSRSRGRDGDRASARGTRATEPTGNYGASSGYGEYQRSGRWGSGYDRPPPESAASGRFANGPGPQRRPSPAAGPATPVRPSPSARPAAPPAAGPVPAAPPVPPVRLSAPVGPATPVRPSAPVGPATPVRPSAPLGPATPVRPSAPVGPATFAGPSPRVRPPAPPVRPTMPAGPPTAGGPPASPRAGSRHSQPKDQPKKRARQSRGRGNEADWDTTDWDRVSDEDYWAELSADKPLASKTAQSAADLQPKEPTAKPPKKEHIPRLEDLPRPEPQTTTMVMPGAGTSRRSGSGPDRGRGVPAPTRPLGSGGQADPGGAGYTDPNLTVLAGTGEPAGERPARHAASGPAAVADHGAGTYYAAPSYPGPEAASVPADGYRGAPRGGGPYSGRHGTSAPYAADTYGGDAYGGMGGAPAQGPPPLASSAGGYDSASPGSYPGDVSATGPGTPNSSPGAYAAGAFPGPAPAGGFASGYLSSSALSGRQPVTEPEPLASPGSGNPYGSYVSGSLPGDGADGAGTNGQPDPADARDYARHRSRGGYGDHRGSHR